MNHFVIYETATGEIQSVYTGDQSGAQLQCGDNCSFVEGKEQSITHYVVNGVLTAYTDAQKQDKQNFKGAGWAWSNTTMSWQITDTSMATTYTSIMLRAKRDELLVQSDYTQMPDVVLSNQDEWDSYRQALRDLPSNNANALSMDDVVWPNMPQ